MSIICSRNYLQNKKNLWKKAKYDITRPLAKNASIEEYNDYAFAALLSDDDDKMHAALDSLLTSDIGRSTQQEAAALYERQEREEIRAAGNRCSTMRP